MASEGPPETGTEDATPGWLAPSSGDGALPESPLQMENEPKSSSSTGGGEPGKEERAHPRWRCCKKASLGALEVLLLAAFLYSTVVQNDDPDSVQWHIYYGLQAAIPAMFLVHYFCALRLLERAIVALGVAMSVWSVVYIVLISLDLKNLLREDEPDPDAREELVFELAGVSLGLLSAVYHTTMTCCCVRKKKNEG